MPPILLDIDDLPEPAYQAILDLAWQLKRPRYVGDEYRGRTLALYFEKPSLRTRSTLEIAVVELGGHPLFLDQRFIGVGTREPLKDVARNLGRWVTAIAARVNDHATLEGFAEHSGLPVINALSDRAHPLQALADVLTLREAFGDLKGLRLAWIGDGNNVLTSLAKALAREGMRVVAAIPEGYEPAEELPIEIVRDPRAAVKGADAVYTDVWTSMGQEEERAQRLRDFAGYTVTLELFSAAKPTAIFMHCLPAHYGEEVEEAVVDHPRSRVFDQAENRLHAAKAVLKKLAEGGW